MSETPMTDERLAYLRRVVPSDVFTRELFAEIDRARAGCPSCGCTEYDAINTGVVRECSYCGRTYDRAADA